MKKEDKKDTKSTINQLRVAELFAGVGGFRLGLEGSGKKKNLGYKTVWSNQWEPSTKKQHASETYIARFGTDGHSNENITHVVDNKFETIPDHDLLVGGFPCQDYSVARTLSHAEGLQGKKGVLWWSIYNILEKMERLRKGKAPRYLMLENVDRLVKSPAKQRGRDFAVMLSSLSDLGYAVEWRIINAADYCMPQRRRRIFILGYKKGTPQYRDLKKSIKNDWVAKNGIAGKAFKVGGVTDEDEFEINGDIPTISEKFNKKSPDSSPFQNAGVMIDRKIYTCKVIPKTESGPTLGDVIEKDDSKVDSAFFIKKEDIKKWLASKGAKKEERETKTGFTYMYSEGAMSFPDSLDKPSRTIVTGEGGSTPSRFKHVIMTPSGKYRRLTPVELEKLCMFPPEHTAGQSDTKRAFFMGNALVVGVIERLGKELLKSVRSAK